MIGKIFLIGILVYLVIALPLYFYNDGFVEECKVKCSEVGGETYDMVVSASVVNEGISCYCMSSYTRNREYVLVDADE